jgi:hypothetical protein
MRPSGGVSTGGAALGFAAVSLIGAGGNLSEEEPAVVRRFEDIAEVAAPLGIEEVDVAVGEGKAQFEGQKRAVVLLDERRVQLPCLVAPPRLGLGVGVAPALVVVGPVPTVLDASDHS